MLIIIIRFNYNSYNIIYPMAELHQYDIFKQNQKIIIWDF